MLQDMQHGLILKIKCVVFFGGIGDFEDIFFLVGRTNMEILIAFTGKWPEYAGNIKKINSWDPKRGP